MEDSRRRRVSTPLQQDEEALLYKKALDDGGIPQNVSAGYIHPEKKGVIAIDQSGISGAQLRLYLVPQSQEIHLITIGDKRSQQEDIHTALQYVNRQIEEQRMATTLFLMRNREGLTQAQLAERMGCTQSRVSKLEHASLSSISVQDSSGIIWK